MAAASKNKAGKVIAGEALLHAVSGVSATGTRVVDATLEREKRRSELKKELEEEKAKQIDMINGVNELFGKWNAPAHNPLHLTGQEVQAEKRQSPCAIQNASKAVHVSSLEEFMSVAGPKQTKDQVESYRKAFLFKQTGPDEKDLAAHLFPREDSADDSVIRRAHNHAMKGKLLNAKAMAKRQQG